MKMFAVMNCYTGIPANRSCSPASKTRKRGCGLTGKATRKLPLFLVGKPTKTQ